MNDSPIYIEKYITPLGEDVTMYYYLAKDDGKSDNDSCDTHPTFWLSYDEVYDNLSYPSLKIVWDNVKDEVKKYFDNN